MWIALSLILCLIRSSVFRILTDDRIQIENKMGLSQKKRNILKSIFWLTHNHRHHGSFITAAVNYSTRSASSPPVPLVVMDGLPRLLLSSLEPVESPPPTRLWGLARSCISIDLQEGGENEMNCDIWMDNRSTAMRPCSWECPTSIY